MIGAGWLKEASLHLFLGFGFYFHWTPCLGYAVLSPCGASERSALGNPKCGNKQLHIGGMLCSQSHEILAGQRLLPCPLLVSAFPKLCRSLICVQRFILQSWPGRNCTQQVLPKTEPAGVGLCS